VDDALVPAVDAEQLDAMLAAVPLERRKHVLGHDVEERPPLVERGDDVIDGRDRPLRHGDTQTARAEHVERLGRRDLVDQVQPDEQLGLAARERTDSMRVPDFLEKGCRHRGNLDGSTARGAARHLLRRIQTPAMFNELRRLIEGFAISVAVVGCAVVVLRFARLLLLRALLRLSADRLLAQLLGGAGQLGLLHLRNDVLTLPLAAADLVLTRIDVVVFAHASTLFQGRCHVY
jgi:hypothetical protein